MAIHKAKIIFIFVLFVLFFSILTLVYWDFIRDSIIMPIYYLMWVTGLILKSIPQGVYLAILVFFSLITGFKTLESFQVERYFTRSKKERPQTDTQYLRWRNLCANMDVSPFSKNRFVWETRKLILSILAYERGIDIAEAESLVRNGTVEIPETIRYLIQKKNFPDARLPLSRITSAMLRLRRLRFRKDMENDLKISSPVADIIGFIEQHLEIHHAGSQPQP